MNSSKLRTILLPALFSLALLAAPAVVLAAKSLTVTFAGVGGGTVTLTDTTTPANNHTFTGTETVALRNNDTGTLAATPNSTSIFSAWSSASAGITGCSGSSCNFSMGNTTQSVTATFKANQATLTVTGLPASAAYQQAGITAGTSGGSGTGAVTFSAGASTACSVVAGTGAVTITSGTGNCSITAAKATDANYNSATSAVVSVTINKANTTTSITNAASLASTPTVVGQSYAVTSSVTSSAGTATGTTTISGGSGCSASVATGQCSVTSTDAGSKTLVATYGGDSNFNGSVSSGSSHTVNPAATSVLVGSSATPSTYGNTIHFTAHASTTAPGAGTPTGTVQFKIDGGDFGTPVAFSDDDATSGDISTLSAGAHTITAVYGGAANFSGSTSGDFPQTVSASPVTVTANALSKTYGAAEPTLTYGVTGTLVGADHFSGALLRDSGEDVGDYAINQGSLTLGNNYQLNYVGSTFSISTKAVLTVTADGHTITYGAVDPSFTFQYSGFVNGDGASAIDTPPTCSVSGAHTDANTYSIGCSGGADNDYSFSYVSTPMTVNKANAEISVVLYSLPYDGNAHTAGATATGVHSEDLASQFHLSGTTHTNAGDYTGDPWTFTDVTGNYHDASGNVDDAIQQAPLSVTVGFGQSKVSGAADPVLTYTHGALAGGDTDAVFNGDLHRASGESVGTYGIDQGTLSAGGNYSINSFTGANFTINVDPSADSVVMKTSTSDDGTQKSGTITNATTLTTTTSAGNVTIDLPANLTITGPMGWDGTINLPSAVITNISPITDPGNTASVVASIEIGFGNTTLTLNKGVRFLFTGQHGKDIGYSHGTADTFVRITSGCAADDQATGDALAAGSDCKIDVGDDLVVWTKHFSTFTTYTQAPVTAASGGGGVGNGPIADSFGGTSSGNATTNANTGGGTAAGSTGGTQTATSPAPTILAVAPQTTTNGSTLGNAVAGTVNSAPAAGDNEGQVAGAAAASGNPNVTGFGNESQVAAAGFFSDIGNYWWKVLLLLIVFGSGWWLWQKYFGRNVWF